MSQDSQRNELPAGKAWNMVDWLPEWERAALCKRGGWRYYSNALTGSYIWKTDFCPYTSGSHQISFTDTGVLFFDATSKGTQFTPNQTGFLKDLYYFTGANSAKTVNSSGTTATVSTAPKALYACTWGEYMLAANASGSSRYIWFSAPNDPTSWNTDASTGAWFAMTKTIKGLAVANGIILAFSDGGVERLTGTNPPPGGNLARRWLADHGCIDWRSIANWDQYVVWCDIDGVYLTDGNTVTDITQQAGLKQYWIQNVMGSWTSAYTVAAGIYQDKYVVSIMNGGTFVDSLCFDLLRRAGYRFSNLNAVGFSRGLAGASGIADELYAASRATNRILALSSFWNPSGTYKNDGDGTAVTPLIEVPSTAIPFRIPGMRRIFLSTLGGQMRINKVYLGYSLVDAASDNPTLTVSVSTDPTSNTYTDLSPTYLEATPYTRKRLPVRKLGREFGFKIAQQNASATTKILTFGFEGHVQQSSR